MDKRDNNPAHVTSGSYVGNDASDRAIPHGLGRMPKFVHINHNQPSYWVYKDTHPTVLYVLNATLDHRYVMPSMDAIDFYVGFLGSEALSANDSASTFFWVAIG